VKNSLLKIGLIYLALLILLQFYGEYVVSRDLPQFLVMLSTAFIFLSVYLAIILTVKTIKKFIKND